MLGTWAAFRNEATVSRFITLLKFPVTSEKYGGGFWALLGKFYLLELVLIANMIGSIITMETNL